MGFTIPTTPLPQFTPWDVEAGQQSWPDRFAAVDRPSQNTNFLTGFDVVNGAGTDLLRRYASIVTHRNFVVAGAVQNMTEFKLGGVINVALNQENLLGMIWNPRPIVPREKMPEYRQIWMECAKLFEAGEAKTPLSQEKRLLQFKAFLLRASKLIGKYSLEFPRGYGDVTKTPVESAASEAEEELQVRCVERIELGLMGEDTAQNPALNTYCYARMDVKGKPSVGRDLWEKIAMKAEWLTLHDLYKAVEDGHVLDPYTLTALQMLQIYRPRVYAKIAT